jgi:hypothetical protein
MGGFSDTLCRISLGHLSFMSGKRSKNLIRFCLGNFEQLERSPKLGCNLIELGWRYPEITVGDL